MIDTPPSSETGYLTSEKLIDTDYSSHSISTSIFSCMPTSSNTKEKQQVSSVPFSPESTVTDDDLSSFQSSTIPPFNASFFRDGLSYEPSRSSTIESSIDSTRHSTALDQLAYDSLIYLMKPSTTQSPSLSTSSLSQSAMSEMSSSDPCNANGVNHAPELTEKLKCRLTKSTTIHPPPPCLLELAQDVLSYISDIHPLTKECQQLEPKLKAYLLLYGKNLS